MHNNGATDAQLGSFVKLKTCRINTSLVKQHMCTRTQPHKRMKAFTDAMGQTCTTVDATMLHWWICKHTHTQILCTIIVKYLYRLTGSVFLWREVRWQTHSLHVKIQLDQQVTARWNHSTYFNIFYNWLTVFELCYVRFRGWKKAAC